MRVLLINKFLYARGGDAISTLDTGRLLKAHGHQVVYWGMAHPANPIYPYQELFTKYVDLNAPVNLSSRLKIAANLLYSFEAKNKIERLVQIEKPDIVHLNNFAHQISPSILRVFQRHNIPTVMTLHDYKMVCASYLMINRDKTCEACRHGKYYMCFLKKCVKDSILKSFLNTVEMYLHHKILHLYDSIDIFISPSVFLKQKLHDMGFNNKKIVYLPNFVNGANKHTLKKTRTNRFLYFGRLSNEKGLETLIKAAGGMDIELYIAGTGSHEPELKQVAVTEAVNNVYFMGYKSGNELAKEIREALAVVVPSQWYENNPRTVLESFTMGTPVIGANIGGIPEIVLNNETGLTFRSGDVDDLRRAMKFCINNKGKVWAMGKRAQQYVRKNFNAPQFYEGLMNIYHRVTG
ncbi:MAG: glycosyltransferase family 4 protein [bacterium]